MAKGGDRYEALRRTKHVMAGESPAGIGSSSGQGEPAPCAATTTSPRPLSTSSSSVDVDLEEELEIWMGERRSGENVDSAADNSGPPATTSSSSVDVDLHDEMVTWMQERHHAEGRDRSPASAQKRKGIPSPSDAAALPASGSDGDFRRVRAKTRSAGEATRSSGSDTTSELELLLLEEQETLEAERATGPSRSPLEGGRTERERPPEGQLRFRRVDYGVMSSDDSSQSGDTAGSDSEATHPDRPLRRGDRLEGSPAKRFLRCTLARAAPFARGTLLRQRRWRRDAAERPRILRHLPRQSAGGADLDISPASPTSARTSSGARSSSDLYILWSELRAESKETCAMLRTNFLLRRCYGYARRRSRYVVSFEPAVVEFLAAVVLSAANSLVVMLKALTSGDEKVRIGSVHNAGGMLLDEPDFADYLDRTRALTRRPMRAMRGHCVRLSEADPRRTVDVVAAPDELVRCWATAEASNPSALPPGSVAEPATGFTLPTAVAAGDNAETLPREADHDPGASSVAFADGEKRCDLLRFVEPDRSKRVICSSRVRRAVRSYAANHSVRLADDALREIVVLVDLYAKYMSEILVDIALHDECHRSCLTAGDVAL